MRIGFIGAGKVGTAFGIYLKAKGFLISGFFSRTKASSLQAASKTESNSYDSMNRLVEASDIIFITTSDDQIKNVCQILCQDAPLRQNQLFVHMSGALASTVLSPLKVFGCYIYSMHPLQAFAAVEKAVSDLSKTYFCLEGDEEKISVLESMLQTCGNEFFKLEPEQKLLYHSSACMLSNYLVTLVHNGLKIMEDIHIDSTTAFKAMLPLINGTVQNILELGTDKALTGPIARGDIKTVAEQLKAISTVSEGQLSLYLCMAEETLKLASLSKLKDSPNIDKLENLIKSYK